MSPYSPPWIANHGHPVGHQLQGYPLWTLKLTPSRYLQPIGRGGGGVRPSIWAVVAVAAVDASAASDHEGWSPRDPVLLPFAHQQLHPGHHGRHPVNCLYQLSSVNLSLEAEATMGPVTDSLLCPALQFWQASCKQLRHSRTATTKSCSWTWVR